ncbi:phage virion morphogenesis protein [Kaistia dalseonensis]|uniref:Phage virion morphogenesis protein n=1 Tax=Kaistia dalseonensis TaxID=410840 RepID=A0ABU0HCB3_9HYPH|nr:phage virion morphogenesis protein [Kaistia dalseonensis]MCX5497318.1 phage virion morphogenesis protein [Kaistia dalseonensis]MDQ0439955.1 phage virion morphogenesis protein [Kaistia dalseonensis]
MTGVSLSTTIDDREARRAFGALQRLMADTTPIMAAIGTGLVRNVHDRFMDADDPDGNAWAPLNPGYAAIKRGPGILRASGMRGGLMGSITQKANRDSVEVGSNKIYAAVHQLGATIEAKNATHLRFEMAGGLVAVKSVTIPARPYLGIGPADERTINETLVDALDRAVQKGAGGPKRPMAP